MQDATRPGSRSRAPAVRLALALVAIATCVALAWSVRSVGRDAATTDEPSSAAVVPERAAAVEDTEVLTVSSSVAPPATESARTSASAAESPEAAGPLVEFVVSTRESLMPDAKFVPEIAIAGGLGAPFDATRAPLVAGRTGADGSAKLALPWSAIESARARGDALWLRVVEPGYQQRTRTLRLPDAAGPKDYTLIAFRGCTLRGRVLDGSGAPVAAKVRVAPWLGERGFAVASLGEARADGWFEVMPFNAGKLQVLADAGDLGTAVMRDLEVTADRVPEPIELVVSGPGIVRGHVSDGAGHAAAGLDLEVVAAEYDRARDEPAVLNAAPGARRLGELELEGRGRMRVDVRTDANGMFEARGLRDDQYVVRERPGLGRGRGDSLTSVPAPSDGFPLDLVLGRPHIAVEVVDAQGAPWIGPKPDPRDKRKSFGWSPSVPPPEALVVVAPALEGLRSGRSKSDWIDTKDLGSGRYSADVADGCDYWVGMFGVSQPWRPVRVTVPKGAGRFDVRIVAASPAQPGVLLVDPRKSNGEPARNGIAIRVEDLASGFALVNCDEFKVEKFPLRIELPEGEYRLTAEGAPFVDGHHGTLMAPRALGRWESVVRVTAGGEIAVAPQIPEGARLRVKLAGAANAEDRATIEQKYRNSSVGVENWREVFSSRAELVLRADGNWPVDVQFLQEWTGSSGAGTHLTKYLALDTEDVSQILPAGRFTLEARLPGGRVARAPVELVDGRTTEVALAFD